MSVGSLTGASCEPGDALALPRLLEAQDGRSVRRVQNAKAKAPWKERGVAVTLKLIRSTEALSVAHPTFLIYSSAPGVGRSSLGYMTRKALNLDFDLGAHRAGNRQDTVQMGSWDDVEELLRGDHLAPYETIIPDTVGRLLDLMTVDIIEKQPKMGRDGSLSQQGWGVLKTRFRTFLARLNALGKDVVLVAHGKEEKDGDTITMKPDIQGGSYGEVLKSADFVGYLHIQGKERVLDFSPTERWIGKNPGQWEPLKVPAYGKDPEFLSKLIDDARKALGRMSEESAAAAGVIADWRAQIETQTTADELNATLAKVIPLEPVIVREQVKRLLWEHATAAKFEYDKAKKAFVARKETPEPKAATA